MTACITPIVLSIHDGDPLAAGSIHVSRTTAGIEISTQGEDPGVIHVTPDQLDLVIAAAHQLQRGEL